MSIEQLLSVFTQEEQEIIRTMCARGQHKDIPGVVKIFDPEREYKLEAIVSLLAPKSLKYESDVKKEIEIATSKGLAIDSPEKEAEWQAKLDAERKIHEEKEQKEKMRIAKNLSTIEKAVEEPVVKAKRMGRPAKVKEEPTSDTTLVDAA